MPDRLLALFLLLLLSPLLLFLAFLLWLSGNGVWFSQTRSGKNRTPFILLKFKTMRDGSQASRERITPLGKIYRRFGLDELPQLFNILKGEMCFIGPRPLLVEYDTHYSARQLKRFEVLPGISGWAQVKEGQNPTWEQRLELDVWYVEHRSFRLNVKIAVLTLLHKLGAKESARMERFDRV